MLPKHLVRQRKMLDYHDGRKNESEDEDDGFGYDIDSLWIAVVGDIGTRYRGIV